MANTRSLRLSDGKLLCGACASPLAEPGIVCGLCGEPQKGEVMGRVCTACGSLVADRSGKCPECSVLEGVSQADGRTLGDAAREDSAARALVAELERKEEAIWKRERETAAKMAELKMELKSLSEVAPTVAEIEELLAAVAKGLRHAKQTLLSLVKHFEVQNGESARRSVAALKAALKTLDEIELPRPTPRTQKG